MDTEAILEKFWQAVEPHVFISRQEFVASFEGWDIAEKDLHGEIVGATASRGPEFHFITFGPKRAFTRGLMRDCVQPIIEKYGYVRTKTPKDDTRQHRFNLLVGFVVESTDEYYTHFRMEKLNLHGAKTCPS